MASGSYSIKSESEHNENYYINPNIKNDGKSFYHFIPARYLFVFMGFTAFNLVYAYKVVLSVAIVAMAGHQTDNNTIVISECLVNNSGSNSSLVKPGEFEWTSNQQSILLGAFFYGYVITQLPAGFLSERYGAKWIFGVSMLVTGLLSLLIPFAARIHWIALFCARFLQGKF